MYVEVLLDQNLAKPLDYKIPEHLQVKVGMRVEIPLKSTLKKGTIVKIKQEPGYPEVKEIVRILSETEELSKNQWELAFWMSHYYAAPLQRVLKCFIPSHIRKNVKQKTHLFLEVIKTHEECLDAIQSFRKKAPQKGSLLETLLNAPKGMFLSELPFSKGVIDSLIKEKWISSRKIQDAEDLLLEEEFFQTPPKTLNEEQKSCLDAVVSSIQSSSFASHLLYGVTGSGKTEVYMQAIQETLNQKKSVILLVPEVSLTSQTIERFRARFSEKIAILHHKRSQGQRTSAWEGLRNGDIKLVIGARSALFCPIQNLGLIIVDEEHDSSYKQTEEAPCYHGRDTAVMRAYIEKCTILLGSATPSIESFYNTQIGKYQLHELKARATKASIAMIQIVDMAFALQKNKNFTHFSEELIVAIKNRLSKGEQILLFLNKRGYRRQQVCSSCRYILKCPHCDLSLTFHKKQGILQCHLCDFKRPLARECPQCQKKEDLEFKGFGTEHVEASLHALFPEIRTLRMDKDTTTSKDSHETIFKQFRSHKADVLIGTQMVAKGFHFPSVTLVGILNTDATLSIPDFRTSEQVFQLITQVAGRAGRAELKGEVIIQSFFPEHPTIQLAAKQDFLAFYQKEIEERKLFCYPPFCHLIKLLFIDSSEEKAKAKADAAYTLLKSTLPKTISLLPVVPAGHPKVKDNYRFQLVIKTSRIQEALPFLTNIQDAKIDIDPTSIFF